MDARDNREDRSRRKAKRREWRREWTVSWAAAKDGVWPAPLHRPDGNLWASNWNEAAIIEARVHGISVAEVLSGEIDPVAEASRALEDERNARRRYEKLRRARARGFVLLFVLIMGGYLGCLAAYLGGHNVLASALAAVASGGIALLLMFPEVELY